MERYSTFVEMADNMSLADMRLFKQKATEAYEALKALETLSRGAEPLSDYAGMSFSHLMDDIVENLACCMDARIANIESYTSKLTCKKIEAML